MKGISIVWIRVILFILISLYSIVVFGQSAEDQPHKNSKIFQVYPTVSTFDHRLDLVAACPQSVVVSWVDLSGRLVMKEKLNLEKGDNSFSVRNLGRLSKGCYVLSVIVDGKKHSGRLMIM